MKDNLQTIDMLLCELLDIKNDVWEEQSLSDLCGSALNEINRLRRWLSYINENHSDHRQAAKDALDGKPLPESYND